MLTIAQEQDLKISPEISRFVGKDEAAIWLETADLNGDGAADFVLVTEKPKAKSDAGDDDENDKRNLLILVRGADGKLTIAKRNSEVVYCKSCGGVFGDPFAGIEVKRNGFIVNNYGGSSWRWSDSYEFGYSRRDRTWQLIEVVQESFRSFEPEKVKMKILKPKNFGKIDIGDFDVALLNKPKKTSKK